MLRLLGLSLAQLSDRAVLRVLAKSLGLTLLAFVALWLLLGYGAYAIGASFQLSDGLSVAVGVAATAAALLAAWLLFRVVAILILQLFGDEIVATVEARHYPEAARRARHVSFARSLRMGLRSAGRALLFNLLALPLYVVLIVTGVGSVALFVGVNALLLGRDLGEMVAVRHLSDAELKSWLAATKGRRAFLGLIVTILFTVPVANLLAPILGAAMATHLFHRERA